MDPVLTLLYESILSRCEDGSIDDLCRQQNKVQSGAVCGLHRYLKDCLQEPEAGAILSRFRAWEDVDWPESEVEQRPEKEPNAKRNGVYLNKPGSVRCIS